MCVCVCRQLWRPGHSVLAPGWRFGVFLLVVIKKRGVLSLLSCLGVLSTVSCGSLGIGLKFAILKYPEIKASEEIIFFLLQQRPLSLLCLASKTTLTFLPNLFSHFINISYLGSSFGFAAGVCLHVEPVSCSELCLLWCPSALIRW